MQEVGPVRSIVVLACLFATSVGAISKCPASPFTDCSSAYEYFSNPWALIGLKDYPTATRIAPYLALCLGDHYTLRFYVGESGHRVPPRIRRTLSKGYLPIVQLRFLDRDGLRYEFEFLTAPGPQSPTLDGYATPISEGNFLNCGSLTITQTSYRRGRGCLGFELVRDCRRSPADPPDIVPQNLIFSRSATGEAVVESNGREVFRLQTTGRTFRRDGKLWTSRLLRPGEKMSTYIQVPYWSFQPAADTSPPLGLRRTVLESWAERCRDTVSWWSGFLNRHPAITVPEQKVMDCYRTALVQQFITRDQGVVKPGEGFYDKVYLRDAAYQIYALEVMGYLDEARESLEHCVQFQRPDGRFESQTRQFDANGYTLWVIMGHYRLTHDRAWLRRVFPRVTASANWILRALHSTKKSPTCAGLLPAAPADGENLWDGDCHIVGYDLWNLRGLECAAECAEVLGEDRLASSWRESVRPYREQIRSHLRRRGYHHFPPSYEGRGANWGNLELIFPTALYPPTDPWVNATYSSIESTYREGSMPWSPGTVRAIHPYATAFIHISRLLQGDYHKAMEGFYSQLLHTTAANGFSEGIFDDRRFAWRGTIPHQWGSAMFLIYLRHLLVQERGDTLVLLPAVPDHWLSEGKTISWKNLPTSFGKVSARFSRSSNHLTINISTPQDPRLRCVEIHLPPSMRFQVQTLRSSPSGTGNARVLRLGKGKTQLVIHIIAPQSPTVLTFEQRARL